MEKYNRLRKLPFAVYDAKQDTTNWISTIVALGKQKSLNTEHDADDPPRRILLNPLHETDRAEKIHSD